MKKRIFVAGASGVIGRPLCRLLVGAGWRVIGTTRREENIPALKALGMEPVVVDVFDRDALVDIVAKAKPDVVIHQLTDLPDGLEASRMPDALIRNARIREFGTQNLVDAAIVAGAGRMIAQSISFVYAPGPTPHTEDDPLNLTDPLFGPSARAVASLERQVLNAPFTGIVLRYGKLYGPGTGFASMQGGGALHVDAAADAAFRAVTRGVAGVYNIAEDDGDISVRKAVSLLGWDPGVRPGRQG
jgi:nucleoside-diphosphate-sugar epimerase